eukprot:scaffold2337_cov201-Isochrysis_galbana.AAC.1
MGGFGVSARRGSFAGGGRSRRGGTLKPVPLPHIASCARHFKGAELGDETFGFGTRTTREKRLTLASPRPPRKRCRGRTRRARSESACQQVRPLEAALREARTGSDWQFCRLRRRSRCKVRVERAREIGKRGPARGAIFGPLLPSEKGGEEVVRGVGVRALAEEVAQSGDELPPRTDDVEPARDEADQLFAQGTTSARIRHRIPRQLERVVEGHKE